MPKTKAIAAAFILLFLSMPFASALDMGDVGLGELLNEIGKLIDKIRQEPEAQLGIIFIMFFIIFYAVLNSALKRVKLFEGEGGIGLSKPGHMVALSIAGLMCFSIFFVKEPTQDLINRILNPFGVFGGAILAGGVFALVTLGFKDEKVMGMDPKMFGFMAAGIALLAVGGMLNLNSMYGWGWFLTLGTLIFWGISGLVSRWAAGRGDSAGKREKETEDEIREQQAEKERLNKMGMEEQQISGMLPEINAEIQTEYRTQEGMKGIAEEIKRRINGIAGLRDKDAVIKEITTAGNYLRQLYAITKQVEERERQLKKQITILNRYIKDLLKKELENTRKSLALEERIQKEAAKEAGLQRDIEDLNKRIAQFNLSSDQRKLRQKEAQLAELSVEAKRQELEKEKALRQENEEKRKVANDLLSLLNKIISLENSMKNDTESNYKILGDIFRTITEPKDVAKKLVKALKKLDEGLTGFMDKIGKYELLAKEFAERLVKFAEYEDATKNLRQQIEAIMGQEIKVLIEKAEDERRQARQQP